VKFKSDFLRIPVIFAGIYIIFKVFYYFIIPYSTRLVLIVAYLLFGAAVVIYLLSKKESYRIREITYAVISSQLVYFSIFGTLEFLGIIYFNTLINFFIVLFMFMLLVQGGELRRMTFNLSLFFMSLSKFIGSIWPGYLTSAIVILISVFLAFIVYMKGVRSISFEKSHLFSLSFGFFVILIFDEILLIAR